MKITQGDWKLIPGSTCIQDDQLRNIAYVNYVDMPTDEEIGRDEAEANAALIAEAGTVHNETGYTPRQLADQKKALLDACEMLVRNPIIASVQAPIKAHAEKEGLLNCMDLIFDAIAGATN